MLRAASRLSGKLRWASKPRLAIRPKPAQSRKNRQQMTPTNLEALRRLLFLTTDEAAQFVAVGPEHPQGVSGQEWREWESGAQPVPQQVARRVAELVDWRAAALAATADTIRQQIRDTGTPESVFVIWYDRLDDWLTLPERKPEMWRLQQAVCAGLAGMFNTVRLVAFDPAAYGRWRGERPDTESLRAEWTSSTQA